MGLVTDGELVVGDEGKLRGIRSPSHPVVGWAGAIGVMRRPYGCVARDCDTTHLRPVRAGGMEGLDTPFMLKQSVV